MKGRRGISGPAAAVIFLAVGAAVLLSTSYISDLFGSASFQNRIASKLMISRPYQVGQEVMSLVDSAYEQAAVKSTLETAKTGAGKAVWYCNAPQPPSVSQVKSALCQRTHSFADRLVEERLEDYNYTVRTPECLYINVTGPEQFTLYARGGQKTMTSGTGSLGSTSVNVSSRFWVLYNNLTAWVEDDMGGLFSELCSKASKPCQVKWCSCDRSVVENGLDELFSDMSLTEEDVQDAVEESLSELTSEMDGNVTCYPKLNLVIENSPDYTINRLKDGCECGMEEYKEGCSSAAYVRDPSGTSQMSECNASTSCLRCDSEDCKSILPVHGCSAPIRWQVISMGSEGLADLSQNIGFHEAHIESLNASFFDSNLLVSDHEFRDYELPTLRNFANGRVVIVDSDTYGELTKAGKSFESKGFSTNYDKIANGVVAELNPSWDELSSEGLELLAAHYYDLGAGLLYPEVDFNCTSIIPGGLAAEIVPFPKNGTELLAGIDRKAYVYGSIECRDEEYFLDSRNLVFEVDFWISLQKSCPIPSPCNGTRVKCGGNLDLRAFPSVHDCPKCFNHTVVPGVKVMREVENRVRCRQFNSSSRMICEFDYDEDSVFSEERELAVYCTCYFAGDEVECEQVLNSNSTQAEVRCPVAAPKGTYYSSFTGVRNCGSIQDRFGLSVNGQVCDITCYEEGGEVRCGDCQPLLGGACGCGSCAFQVSGGFDYSGSSDLYWIGEEEVYYPDGLLAFSKNPSVNGTIDSSTCTSLRPSITCTGGTDVSDSSITFGGLFGDSERIKPSSCLTPIKILHPGGELTVCDCLDRADDPSLASDEVRYGSGFLEQLSEDDGFMSCCEECVLSRLCGVSQSSACRSELIDSTGRQTNPEWSDFVDCCDEHLSPCYKCSCLDGNDPFCENPACGLVWENTCYPLVQDSDHSTCSSFACVNSTSESMISQNFLLEDVKGLGCSPVEDLGCGCEGECGSCVSRSLNEVTGMSSDYSNVTGYCVFSPIPPLSEVCEDELKYGKDEECLWAGCDYEVGGFACFNEPAGVSCPEGECDGLGVCE